MEINYKKNKNRELFEKMSSSELLDLDNLQNYIPIYNKFFNLNETNYNSINLNNIYRLNSIREKTTYNKFLGSITDNSENILEKKVFFKFSPLVDPIKYMIGKYDCSYNIFQLPKFIDYTNNSNDINLCTKIYDENNYTRYITFVIFKIPN